MRLPGRLRDERGSQMVEFALIGPIVIYLVLAIPVFGMFTRTWLVVSAAARDGARAGALVSSSDSARRSRAIAEAAAAVYLPHTATAGGKSHTYFDPNRDVNVFIAGDHITVAVTYHQPSYLPLLGALLGGSGPRLGDTVPLTARASFRLEGS